MEPAAPAPSGRTRLLADLAGRLATATAGQAAVVLLTADPGMGKTHLLRDLQAHAANAGCTVLAGAAFEAEGMPPYLPFIDALAPYLRRLPLADLEQQAGPFAAGLAGLFPEVAARLPSEVRTPTLPPEQAQLRLFEAVAGLLTAIAAPAGLLLVLDDLQWADRSSLDLLCYLLRREPQARLLVACAVRGGEASPALERALAELNRLRVLSALGLPPLDAAELQELAIAQAGAALDGPALTLLAARSEGNPFFAEELLHWWQAHDRLQPSDGAPRMLRLAGATDDELPDGIQAAVGLRVGALPDAVVEALRVAAIAGRRFDLRLLAAALGEEPEAVEPRLETARHAGVVQADGDTRYRFTHDMIRAALYAQVSPLRRQRLHGFLGHALEADPTPDAALRTAQLAYHYTRSADRERGATFALAAAEHATGAHAHQEAAEHLRSALALLPAADGRRPEALLHLGEALMAGGAVAEAVAVLTEAVGLLGSGPLAGVATHRLGRARWRQEQVPEARHHLEHAAALLEGAEPEPLAAVLVDLANLLGVSLHELAAAQVQAERALALATTSGQPLLLAAAHRTLGNLLVRANRPAEGLPLLEQALRLAGELGAAGEAAECCACLAVARYWLGDLDGSAQASEQRLTFARQTGDPYESRHVYTWLHVVRSMQGRQAEAEQWLAQAQAMMAQVESPEPRAWLAFVRGAGATMRGDYATGEVHLAEAVAAFRGMGPGALVWYLGMYALALAGAGKRADAVAVLDELEALLTGLPADSMAVAEPRTYLLAAALALGDRGRVDRYAPLLAPFAGQFHDFLPERLLGEVAIGRREWADAERLLAQAEAAARRSGLAFELPAVLAAQGRLAQARGGRNGAARARACYTGAVEAYEAAGNAAEAARLRQRLALLGAPGQTAPVSPAGLSQREVEVLRLLAEGRSNRDIAAALVLSEKTVETHIANIYAKTGAENRAAAAAFAQRHALLEPAP